MSYLHRTKHKYAKNLIITIIIALIFGTIMVYNATAVHSFGLFGGAYRFAILQIGWVCVGLGFFYFFSKYDYTKLAKVSRPFYIVACVFLGIIATVGLFRTLGWMPCNADFGFAPCVNGATRWIYINPAPLPRLPVLGVLGFQPSEFAKLGLILFLAAILSKAPMDKTKIFWHYILICGLVSGLIILQPNMSTAVLVFGIGTIMYFISGGPLKPLAILLPSVFIFGIIVILLSPYRRDRLMTFIGGAKNEQAQEEGYHIKQIQIALGSGGAFGVGFGQSRQKFQYLPEVAADSIFAVIGEELGLLGTLSVLLLFGFIFYFGIQIAASSRDLYGRLLAVGIICWIGFQFFINIAAMTKIIPLTGVPIPLISYGGSSTVFSLMGLGILANIGKRV